MKSDWDLWACAQEVVAQHGADARAFVARRLADLAAADDEEGIWHWFAVDDRVKALLNQAGSGALRH